MDEILQILILVIVPITNFFVIRHTKTWLNPLTIISVVFFLPLIFALSRLSALQAEFWAYDTYAVILLTLIFWVLFPTIYLLLQKKHEHKETRYQSDQPYLKSKAFELTARWFALLVGSAYLLANYIQASSLLPFLQPELAVQIHAEFPPGIRLIARAGPAAIALLFVSFFYNRKKFDLVLMLCIFLIPLSRLSRIDPFISGMMMLVLNGYFPLIKYRSRSIVIAICLAAVIGVVGLDLGNQRTNQFGRYEVKYEDAILWKPDVTGPLDVLPSLYGFFPLSFENFDVFVRTNKGNYTYGLQSLDWLLTGVFKFNILRSFQELKYSDLHYRPVSSGATVPTVLFPFYADFGAAGSAIPLFIYMLIWLEFFRRAARSPLFAVLFALSSGGFALATFQAVIVSPLLVQQLIEIAIIFFIVRHLAKKSDPRVLLEKSTVISG